MINSVLTIVSVIDFVLLNLTYLRSIFERIKITFKIVVSACMLCVLMSIVTLLLGKYVFLKIPANFVLIVLFYVVVLNISIKSSLLINALYYGILTSLEIAALIILRRYTNVTVYIELVNSNGAFLAELICQLLFLILIIIISSFRKHTNLSRLSVKGWVTFLLFPVMTLAVAFMMIYELPLELLNKMFYRLIILALFMFVLNILLFYLLDNIIEREQEIQKNKNLIEQAEYVNMMYHSISEERERQKAQAHDHLNHLNVVLNLAREGNNVNEIKYLEELIGNETECIDIIDTGNPVINAVLNIKYKEAQDKGIMFPIVADDLSNLPIKCSNLVTILSNILDNAIEAVKDLDNKKIQMRITRSDDLLSIDSSNPYKGVIPDVKHRFTTKKAKQYHGFGLSNIRHAVEDSGGVCYIDTRNNEFHIVISIPVDI